MTEQERAQKKTGLSLRAICAVAALGLGLSALTAAVEAQTGVTKAGETKANETKSEIKPTETRTSETRASESRTSETSSTVQRGLLSKEAIADCLKEAALGTRQVELSCASMIVPGAWEVQTYDREYKRLSAQALHGAVSATLSVEKTDKALTSEKYIDILKESLAMGLGIEPKDIVMAKNEAGKLAGNDCREVVFQFKQNKYPMMTRIYTSVLPEQATSLIFVAPEEIATALAPTFDSIQKSVKLRGPERTK